METSLTNGQTSQRYRILSQGRSKPFTDTAMLFGHLVRLAQPILRDFYGDLFYDALWLQEHGSNIAPNQCFTWHWYVSDSHTTIHHKAEPYKAYGDKLHYMFTLYLGEDGWWTLHVVQVPALSPWSPISVVKCRTCGEGGHQVDGQCVMCSTNPQTAGK